jgi:hypothetical protein
MRRVVGSLFDTRDPLLASIRAEEIDSSKLRTQELREILPPGSLSAWTLDVRTIDLLWECLRQERPSTILECGAGVSTLIFTTYASLTSPMPFVLSFEQDDDYRRDLERRLVARNVQRNVRIIHVPVEESGRYRFDDAAIERALAGRRADLLLIDGPSGPPGCRDSTLPALARFCRSGARWFLDDAFRDGELKVLEAWSNVRGFVVEGIVPVAKGLATGTVTDPDNVH